MTRDKWWQAKFSGFLSRWKQFLSLKNCLSVRICSVLNRSNPEHYGVLPSHILRVLLTKYGKMTQERDRRLILLSVVSGTFLKRKALEPNWSKIWAHSWHSFALGTGMNDMWTNGGAKALVLSSSFVTWVMFFIENISKCSFPKDMSRPAFTRPSNKIFIPFNERLLYGVISQPKFKVCFRWSSLSFNLVLHYATFEFYNSTLMLEMRHWSFPMRHRSSVNIQVSTFNSQVYHSTFKF